MPRDKRLFMTFPIDFADHPKIAPLSDAAFRAFVEMNGYCRQQKTDGAIPTAYAHKRWGKRRIDELAASHPDRPVLIYSGDSVVLREYAEHQMTVAEQERLAEVSRANGSKGGRPPKNPAGLTPGSDQEPGQEPGSKAESRVKRQTDDRDYPGHVTQGDVRDEQTDEEFTAEAAKTAGIRNLPRVRRALEAVVGELPSDAHAIDLARAVILLANEPVRSVEAYLEAACRNSPDEVEAQLAVLAKGWPR